MMKFAKNILTYFLVQSCKVTALGTLFVMLSVSFAFPQSIINKIEHSKSMTNGLKAPLKIAIDNMDNIYIADPFQKSIIKYDPSGNFVKVVLSGIEPVSIAINSSNELFIGEAFTGNILKVNPGSTTTLFYDGCELPADMVFGSDGLLYIADSKQGKILVLDAAASVRKTIGDGILVYPASIAFDVRNNRLIVAEHGGVGEDIQKCGGMLSPYGPVMKIYHFDLQGNLVYSFGCHGNDYGKFNIIQGIAVGTGGNLFVVESFQGEVSVFDENFNFIGRFGYFGNSLGELNSPTDIAFNSRGEFFIASMNNGALEAFNVNDSLPTSTIFRADAIICPGDSADIKVHFTGTPPWTFSYAINDVNHDTITTINNPYILTVGTSGLYKVTSLTDKNYSGVSLTGAARIIVTDTLPSAEIKVDKILLCEGQTAVIPVRFSGTPPWSFTYTLDGMDSITTVTDDNPYEIRSTLEGEYKVIAISDAGCKGNTVTGKANVVKRKLPTAMFRKQEVLICKGDTAYIPVDFTGSAPYHLNYTLNEGKEFSFVTYNNPYIFSTVDTGYFEIISVSDSFCTNSATSLQMKVTGLPVPSATMKNNIYNVCEGDSGYIQIVLTGTSEWDLTYSINDTIISQPVKNIVGTPYYLETGQEGIYRITQINDANCSGITSGMSEIIKLAAPEPDFSFDVKGSLVRFYNNSLNSSSYFWDFGDSASGAGVNPVHNYPGPGVYRVVLTASNNLCGERTLTKMVDVLLSVSDNRFNGNIKLYPNPSNRFFNLEIDNPESKTIHLVIFSVDGMMVFDRSFAARHVLKHIDFGTYPDGIYIARIVSDNFIKTVKLVLSK